MEAIFMSYTIPTSGPTSGVTYNPTSSSSQADAMAILNSVTSKFTTSDAQPQGVVVVADLAKTAVGSQLVEQQSTSGSLWQTISSSIGSMFQNPGTGIMVLGLGASALPLLGSMFGGGSTEGVMQGMGGMGMGSGNMMMGILGAVCPIMGLAMMLVNGKAAQAGQTGQATANQANKETPAALAAEQKESLKILNPKIVANEIETMPADIKNMDITQAQVELQKEAVKINQLFQETGEMMKNSSPEEKAGLRAANQFAKEAGKNSGFTHDEIFLNTIINDQGSEGFNGASEDAQIWGATVMGYNSKQLEQMKSMNIPGYQPLGNISVTNNDGSKTQLKEKCQQLLDAEQRQSYLQTYINNYNTIHPPTSSTVQTTSK
jgi:hypothetical protein